MTEPDSVVLWRPTGPEELALIEASGWTAWPPRLPEQELSAIQSAGNRYTLGPGQIGKYFYPTQAQAQAIAAKYEGLGYGNYSVTSTTVTDGLLDGGFVDSISIAGEGDAWFFLEAAVAEIGEVAIIA